MLTFWNEDRWTPFRVRRIFTFTAGDAEADMGIGPPGMAADASGPAGPAGGQDLGLADLAAFGVPGKFGATTQISPSIGQQMAMAAYATKQKTGVPVDIFSAFLSPDTYAAFIDYSVSHAPSIAAGMIAGGLVGPGLGSLVGQAVSQGSAALGINSLATPSMPDMSSLNAIGITGEGLAPPGSGGPGQFVAPPVGMGRMAQTARLPKRMGRRVGELQGQMQSRLGAPGFAKMYQNRWS